MSEKKELNKEQLEKVAGGGQFYRPCDIEWFFSKNATVYVKLDDNTPVEGKVIERGWVGGYGVVDIYHVESTINTNINGWYVGDHFVNNTVSIDKKWDGLAEPTVVAW